MAKKTFTYSMMNNFMNCHKKYEYRYEKSGENAGGCLESWAHLYKFKKAHSELEDDDE